MKKSETYLVFLHYIENEDRFVFCSKKYGHINLNHSDYYFNTNEHDLTLKEAMEYDCIFNQYVFDLDYDDPVETTKDDLHDYEEHVKYYINKCDYGL